MIIKPYLQLCRTHTSPLETIPAIVGAALATGGLFNPLVGLWAIYGLLYHNAGYGMNSLEDWKSGYDKNDPHKQHFPLNTGELNVSTANKFIYSLIIITILYVLFLTYQTPLALAVLILGAMGGVGYNLIGKETILKSFMISFAHSTVFAVPYIAITNSIDYLLITGWLFVFLWVLYQIQIEGDIKDLDTDEANLLKHYGVTFRDNYIRFSRKVIGYSYLLKMITLIPIYLFAKTITTNTFIHYSVIGIIIISLIYNTKLVSNGPYNRQWRISLMAKIEVLMMVALIVSISPVIGFINTLILILAVIFWILTFNMYLWNTLLAPDV